MEPHCWRAQQQRLESVKAYNWGAQQQRLGSLKKRLGNSLTKARVCKRSLSGDIVPVLAGVLSGLDVDVV